MSLSRTKLDLETNSIGLKLISFEIGLKNNLPRWDNKIMSRNASLRYRDTADKNSKKKLQTKIQRSYHTWKQEGSEWLYSS